MMAQMEKGNENAKELSAISLSNADQGPSRLLMKAQKAFEQGDYRKVRKLIPSLLQSDEEEVVRVANDLRRRISIDPVQVVILLLCLCLFLAVFYVYVIR